MHHPCQYRGSFHYPNPVGYMNGSTIQQNNFKTVGFNTIGCNTADIADIKIDDGGMDSIGYMTEVFSIWEGVPTVREGTSLYYLHWSMDPALEKTEGYYWGDMETFEEKDLSIPEGQSFVIECAEGLTITAAGQVPTGTVSFTSIQQNNFTGNPFPATIDVSNIKLDDGGMDSIGYMTEVFSIWEGVPTVREGTSLYYLHWSMDPALEKTEGYYWGDMETFEEKSLPIEPGQGVVIECAEGLTVTIDPPYSL